MVLFQNKLVIGIIPVLGRFNHLLIVLLVVYHLFCGKWLLDFKYDRNQHSHVYYRWVNEIPVLFLFAIILLAVIKPF